MFPKSLSIGRQVLLAILAAGASVAAEPGIPRLITKPDQSMVAKVRPVRSLVDLNGTLYFSAWDQEHGNELWRSVGTSSGTFRVADLVQGPAGSDPDQLVVVNGTLFFTAFDGDAGWQLWRSDGTAGGTSRISRIGDGSKQGDPNYLTAAGGKIYFQRGTGAPELWSSDGTEQGTLMFEFPSKPNRPNLNNATIYWDSVACGEDLYFVDDDGSLWATRGAEQGVRRVWMSNQNRSAYGLCVSNGRVHFLGENKVWESDGSAEGTQVVAWWDERFDGLYPSMIAGFDDGLLVGYYGRDDETGLWISDGSVAGTGEVMRARGASYFFGDFGPVARCGKGFLFAGNMLKQGVEPWFSDGTAKGTRMLANLFKGDGDSSPWGFVSMGKLTFFVANSHRFGEEVWVTQGPGKGARPVADVCRGKWGSVPQELTISGKNAFWVANDGVNGDQLWCSDGSPAGTRCLTRLLSRPSTPYAATLEPSYTLGRDGVFYFPMTGKGDYWASFWGSDGTADGTWQLNKPSNNGAGSYLGDPWSASDRIFYRAWDEASGSDLWMTDGSSEGTAIFFPQADPGGAPEIIGELGGKTILMERYGDQYRGLWRYDGGGKPAVPVGAGDPAPGGPGEFLYFSKWDAATGNEPWVTDGTLEGTHLLKDVRPKTIYDSDPAPGSFPRWLGSAGGKTYFSAEYPFRGRELMVTDGTAAGTMLVADLQTSTGSTAFGSTYEWNGQLYFKATNTERGGGLWRTDGTAAGTIQIKRTGNSGVMSGTGGLDGRFAEAGGKLFFSAGTADSGVELWVSDGTSAGTRLVLDILPGTGGSSPLELIGMGNHVYFTADDGRHGRELWRSDGTPEGTVMVQDLALGWEGSVPSGLVSTGGKLFWNAWTPASATAPYVIDSP